MSWNPVKFVKTCWKRATAGKKLAESIRKHAETFTHAREDMCNMADNVEPVSNTVEDLSRVLSDPEYNCTPKTIQYMCDAMDAMEDTFDRIGATTRDYNRESAPYRWIMRKGAAQNLVAELESQQRQLQFCMSVITTVAIGEITSRTRINADTMSQVQEAIAGLSTELAEWRKDLSEELAECHEEIKMLRRELAHQSHSNQGSRNSRRRTEQLAGKTDHQQRKNPLGETKTATAITRTLADLSSAVGTENHFNGISNGRVNPAGDLVQASPPPRPKIYRIPKASRVQPSNGFSGTSVIAQEPEYDPLTAAVPVQIGTLGLAYPTHSDADYGGRKPSLLTSGQRNTGLPLPSYSQLPTGRNWNLASIAAVNARDNRPVSPFAAPNPVTPASRDIFAAAAPRISYITRSAQGSAGSSRLGPPQNPNAGLIVRDTVGHIL